MDATGKPVHSCAQIPALLPVRMNAVLNSLLIRLRAFCDPLPRRALLGVLLVTAPLALAAEPRLTAKAAILLDADTGEILYARDPHVPLPPASTTKVLSTLIAIERLDPNLMVTVSPSAAMAPPSRVGLRSGDRVVASDLLYGMMLKSGNDASEVVAEAVGGSIPDFARLMNARARQLGALDSHFANPHGLPDDSHVSSAYDLAVIFRYAMLNPTFAQIAGTRNAWVRVDRAGGSNVAVPVPVVTHNRLLGTYEGALGGKTGFTNKAKRCFVGETERGNTRLIVAVLGSSALWEDVRRLFDYGFEQRGLLTPAPQPMLVKAVQREPSAAAPAVARAKPATAARTVQAKTKAKAVRPAPTARVATTSKRTAPAVVKPAATVAKAAAPKTTAKTTSAKAATPAKVPTTRKVARDDRRGTGGRG